MANNWKINKTVDLARGIDGIEVWPHALLVTGDENAHEWNVTVMDNGKAASLKGSVRAYFVRSDGATVTASGSVSGNVATVTLPEACYAYEGDLQAVMQLIESDVSVTISALLLRVRQISTDVIIDPGTEIPSLDDLLAQIEKLKQATKDANAATSKANTAATNADAATSKANASATKADTATAGATAATDRANAAAAEAEKIVVEKNIATKDYVGEQIDGIEIGGRNYLLETNQGIKNWFWSFGDNANTATFTETNYYGRRGVKIVRNESTDTTGWSVLMYENVNLTGLIEDEDYTFSMYIRTNKDLSNLQLGIKNAGSANTMLESDAIFPVITAGSKFIKLSLNVHTKKDLPVSRDQAIYIVMGERGQNSSGATIEIFDAKLERGNKATDWTPAPEDVDAKVDTEIDALEIGGRNYALNTSDEWSEWWTPRTNENNVMRTFYYAYLPEDKHVGDLFTCAIEIEFENFTKADGGNFVLQTQGPVDDEWLVTSIWDNKLMRLNDEPPENGVYRYERTYAITQDNVNSKKFELGFRCNYAGSGRLRVRRVKVEAGQKATDWTPSPYDLHGSRNLLPETNQGTKNWMWSMEAGDATWTEETYCGIRCAKVTRGNIERIGYSVILYNFNANYILPDTDYVLSFYIYPSATTNLTLRICRGDSSNLIAENRYIYAIPKGKWTFCKFHLHTKPDLSGIPLTSQNIYMLDMVDTPGTSYIFRDLQLVQGNFVSDWSPAPEDMQPAIFDSAGNVKLSGDQLGKLAASLKQYLQ